MKRVANPLFAAFLATSCSSNCGSSIVSWFAPNAETLDHQVVDELKGRSDTGDKMRFDHSTFDELLGEHVAPERSLVDYRGLQADRQKLDAYLDQLAGANLGELSESSQLALLINAYNACTLKLIVEHYPEIDSIRDISSPWDKKRCRIGGHKLSLDDIEHGLIRPIYRDPRIHFAVNCASNGCPPLDDEAYRGPVLDKQLDAAARRTIRSPNYAAIESGTLYLTSILNWYGSDFTRKDYQPRASSVARFVARYADERIKKFVQEHDGDPPVGFFDYDWKLNDAAR